MRKRELEKIWRQLDDALEAIEKLRENDIPCEYIDFSALVHLKNEVEELADSKSRIKWREVK